MNTAQLANRRSKRMGRLYVEHTQQEWGQEHIPFPQRNQVAFPTSRDLQREPRSSIRSASGSSPELVSPPGHTTIRRLDNLFVSTTPKSHIFSQFIHNQFDFDYFLFILYAGRRP